jgi:PAS domain S-box-containing protein
MPRVADHIEQHRDALLARYAERAAQLPSAQGLRPHEVLDSAPEYLSALAALSREGPGGEAAHTHARLVETHLGIRLRQGYSQADAVREYVLLGELVTALWEGLPRAEQPPHEDTQRLLEALQGAMDAAVALFSGETHEERQRERRLLRRLEALAAAMQGAGPSPAVPGPHPLEPLLEVVREGMGADGCALFLQEEDAGAAGAAGGTGGAGGAGAAGALVLVASVGAGQEAPGGYRTRAGAPSFIGQVAAVDGAVLLPDAAHAPLEVRAGVREGGVGALLGTRLCARGALLGVLTVALRRLRPFTPQERRLFDTLAEHLAAVLDRARLFARLKDTETRYRLASQAVADAIWDWDLRTDSLHWSEGVERLLGFDRGALGTHITGWSDHIHAEDRAGVLREVHAVIDGGGTRYSGTYRFRHGAGHWVRVLDTGMVERDGEGRPVRMVGAMRDVTAEHAAAQVLRESEERLALAVASGSLGTWDFSPLTGVLRWDARSRALFGVPPEVPVTWDTFVAGLHPEDRARVEALAARALDPAGEGGYDTEYRTVGLTDGVVRWVRATGRAFFEGGRPVRFIGTLQDVTRSKQTEAELSRLAEGAARRADFEQQLIGIVSHDLRSPLQSILLAAAALTRREELDDRTLRGLTRIRASAERAGRMIRDLLDFTQARLGGGIPLVRREVDLHALAREVTEEAAASYPERLVEVAGEGDARGLLDPDRVAQVVQNLVSNALKYSPEGAPVRVHTRGEGGRLLLEVHNTGAPIPPERLPALFEPLQRATDVQDRAGRSVGLGLFIVRHLVEAHGGEVSVRSSAEDGTTFTVSLPRAPGRGAALRGPGGGAAGAG